MRLRFLRSCVFWDSTVHWFIDIYYCSFIFFIPFLYISFFLFVSLANFFTHISVMEVNSQTDWLSFRFCRAIKFKLMAKSIKNQENFVEKDQNVFAQMPCLLDLCVSFVCLYPCILVTHCYCRSATARRAPHLLSSLLLLLYQSINEY